jgi:hypothetical protein
MLKRNLRIFLFALILAGSASPGLAEQAGGGPGYFAAADLPQILSQGGERLEKNAGEAFRAFFSPVSYEGDSAVIKFQPPVYPSGIPFYLTGLDRWKTGDTLQLSVPFRSSAPGELLFICVGMIVEASQPGLFTSEDMRRDGVKIEEVLHNGGETVINGWTYRMVQSSDSYVFSATAPARPWGNKE